MSPLSSYIFSSDPAAPTRPRDLGASWASGWLSHSCNRRAYQPCLPLSASDPKNIESDADAEPILSTDVRQRRSLAA